MEELRRHAAAQRTIRSLSATATRPGSPTRRAALAAFLLPASRWARVALLLLVLFTLCRGVLWASTQPAWFAPDEDYHWLYTEQLLINKTVPDLDKPAYTEELYVSALFTEQGQYFQGVRQHYSRGPRTSLDRLKRHGGSREATGQPPRPVLHPPLYHFGAVLADRAVTGELAPVRLTVIRYWSVLLGVLCVYLGWLLAAQVLSRTWHQLAAAALVATQPGLAFASARVGNDILAACTFTAVLIWCTWLLRNEPRARQGWVLGVLLSVALLSKATSLALVGVIAVALLLAAATRRDARPALRGLTWRAALAVVVLAGPWYAFLVSETGSILGNRGAVAGRFDPGAGLLAMVQPALIQLDAARDWLRDAYETYFIHQFPYEVFGNSIWYWIPAALGAVALAGLVRVAWSARRTLLAFDRPLLRQMIVLVLAPLAVTAPFFVVDMVRTNQGQPFAVGTGRFTLAAAPAVATLMVVGLDGLLRRRALKTALVSGAVALSLVVYCQDYIRWGIERYYGRLGDLGTTLRHATWDKPEWVTQGFLASTALLGLAVFLAAVAVTVVGVAREARAQPGR